MRKLVSQLIIQSKKATPRQLLQLANQAKVAPFAGDLLEVDEPLWGGFWQGDVIAPGYCLPAVELSLLRAMRLDTTWPEGTSVAQFLADLRQATSQPQAGVWTLMVAGEPCVVFASVRRQGVETRGRGMEIGDRRPETSGRRPAVSGQPMATVVWYCATTGQLHAGYRATVDSLNFVEAVEQRQLQASGATHSQSISHHQPNWLEQVLDQYNPISGPPSHGDWPEGRTYSPVGGHHLVARLDTEILRLRAQMKK